MRFVESQKEIIDTLRNPAKHSSVERKRAYLFVFVYILAFIAFCGNLFHFVSGWIACIVVELVQLIFAVIYAFNINDYSEKSMSAMECERACNPLIDGYLALRVVQIVQSLFLSSYILPVALIGVLGFELWRVKLGFVYVDATSLWREVSRFEKESYIMIGVDVVLLILVLMLMVFSIIFRYS